MFCLNHKTLNSTDFWDFSLIFHHFHHQSRREWRVGVNLYIHSSRFVEMLKKKMLKFSLLCVLHSWNHEHSWRGILKRKFSWISMKCFFILLSLPIPSNFNFIPSLISQIAKWFSIFCGFFFYIFSFKENFSCHKLIEINDRNFWVNKNWKCWMLNVMKGEGDTIDESKYMKSF